MALSSPSHDAGPPAWLAQARARIERDFHEPISLTDLATEAQVHPVYLARLFRRHYGCSINQLLRRCRVEFAQRALVESDAPLKNIATDAGFYDQAHFSRAFKSLTGLAPADYRRQVQNRER